MNKRKNTLLELKRELKLIRFKRDLFIAFCGFTIGWVSFNLVAWLKFIY